jgi:hypothetical protein
MLANGLGSTARSRSRFPRREFVTTIGIEELGRYAGLGLSLEEVIGEEVRHAGNTPGSSVDDRDDVIIWEGNRALALIRVGRAGEPIVIRFDQVGLESTTTTVPHRAAVPTTSTSRDEVSLEATSQAIAHLRALRHRLERDGEHPAAGIQDVDKDNAFRCGTGRDRKDPWTSLLRMAEAAAERHLLFCLLLINGKLDDPSDLTTVPRDFRPCGVIDEGRLYLALHGRGGATDQILEVTDLVRLDQKTSPAPPRAGCP